MAYWQIEDQRLAKLIARYLKEECEDMSFQEKIKEIIKDHDDTQHLAFSVLSLMSVIHTLLAEE